MKILIITGIFPPDIGGPATYVPAIAQALGRKGHQVSVLTLSDHRPSREDIQGYSVVRISRGLPRLLRIAYTLCKVVRLGRAADVLFVHGLALEAVLANVLLRKPLVHKVVGDLAWERAVTRGLSSDCLDDFQKASHSLRVELLKRLRSFWTARGDHVITPSRYLKKIVCNWGIDEHKVTVICNAAVKRAHEQIDGTETKRTGNTVVSVGRLVPWKGFDKLVAVIGRMPDAELIIVGEGPERPRLEAIIAQAGLGDRVRLAGRHSRDNVFSLLKCADVFVLNSSYEGLPHIVLEAMAAGTPVIAADAGGTREIVQNGYNGMLVPPEDSRALEQTLRELLDNPARRAELARNGLRSLEKWTFASLADETERVLEDACRRAREDRPLCPSGPVPVLFLSTVRFTEPPGRTLCRKWRGLGPFFISTVIAFRDGFLPRKRALEGARWILLPARLPRLVRYGLHFFVSIWTVLAGTLRGTCSVVIAQSPYEGLSAAVALLPWRLLHRQGRPRLIIEIHSDWTEGVMLYHRTRFAWFEKPLRSVVGRFCLSQADAYRAISQYARALLPAGDKPVFVFPTFTDIDSFREPPLERVRCVAQRQGTGFFLYAGMLIYLKGIHHLLNAFETVVSRHPHARLVIAGRGSDEQALRAQAHRLSIGASVFFVGQLSQQDLAAYIINSTALVLPSLTEGLGRVALEAHLLSRPVIGSRTGGIPEIVTEGKSGFLTEPGDEKALSAALLALLEDGALARSMGKAGRKHVVEKFNFQTYFESYAAMVNNICAR